ncbi:DUF6620 family protein [Chitinophaga niabensis]|uniref:DUF6620 family protein n=1 Tax=Chitinophaga niabensis TaxID=536979 RepID=UPI0031BA13AC
MFKKLLNDLLGNEDEKKPQQPQQQEAQQAAPAAAGFDPETFHGLHYTEAQFEAEVEKRVQAFVADSDEDLLENDIMNLRTNFGRDVFTDWNGWDRYEQFSLVWGSKVRGIHAFGIQKADESDPLLQPIHGVSLYDYAAAASKLGSGVSTEQVCKALGIELPVWDEINVLWPKRMQEDSSFQVVNVFSQYFGQADQHPVLGKLTAASSGSGGNAAGAANLQRLEEDLYFYHELCGARQAAYEYGLDGAQWILDNYGITLGEFQGVAVKHMEKQNQQFNSQDIMHYMNYQDEKQKEYAEKFAAEQGGNVADDITF